MTLGAQYLTRNTTFKKFVVRATQPTFLCATPKTDILAKLSYYPGVPHVRTSTAQKRLSQNVQPLPLPWDDQYDQIAFGSHERCVRLINQNIDLLVVRATN